MMVIAIEPKKASDISGIIPSIVVIAAINTGLTRLTVRRVTQAQFNPVSLPQWQNFQRGAIRQGEDALCDRELMHQQLRRLLVGDTDGARDRYDAASPRARERG